MKKTGIFLIIFLAAFCFCNLSPCHARPPKPGPDFVWVAPHTNPNGVFIHGHWEYTGPEIKGKVWIPEHYNAAGKLVPGHWQILSAPPRDGAVWVPGHFAPKGRWIPGYWR